MTAEKLIKPELGGFEGKIISYHEAIEKIKESKEDGLRTIFAHGVFDVLHVGHLEYLRQSKLAGEVLFVGLENDQAVRLNKGASRPFNNLADRCEFLAQLEMVDFVFGFNDVPKFHHPSGHKAFITRYRELNPDFVTLGTWDTDLELKISQLKAAKVKLICLDLPKRESTSRLLKVLGYE